MRVDLFDFILPPERIAVQPADPRESARLLHVPSSGVSDLTIGDLPSLLRPGDVMVFNDTRVIPARLRGRRGDVPIEILLHKALAPLRWQVFAKPAKRLKTDDVIRFAEDFTARVIGKQDDGQVVLEFDAADETAFKHLLSQHGEMPLPPYITRPEGATADDTQNYQTIYARADGSVAAPTAGLHFTAGLLEAVKARGVETAHVTLHVGGGTFLPVKTDDTAEHVMHSEFGEINAETAKRINACRAAGGRIIAVGTTSLRLLESAADAQGILHPFARETDIFITPGYRFKAADGLLTNFHLPRSTLFMLVCAFSGRERMLQAYHHAIHQGYRFYSYGDACFLEQVAA